MIKRWVFLVAVISTAPSLAWARETVPFSGILDFKASQLQMVLGEAKDPVFTLHVARVLPRKYHWLLGVSHVKTPVWDVATTLEGDLEIIGTEPHAMALVGEIASRYTLFDYRPVRDLYAKFSVRDRKLQLDSFWCGAFSGNGVIDLLGDKRMDISVGVLSLDLEEAMTLMQAHMNIRPVAVTGVVTGQVTLRGAIDRPQISGRMALYNGRFEALDYESIAFDFDGTFPLVRLSDIVLTSQEGMSVRLKGALDLSDLGHLDRQLRAFQQMPIVGASGDRPEWVLKRMSRDGEAKTEMKYFLMKDDRGDASAVLGVQKSIGF